MADLIMRQVQAVIDNRTTNVCLHAAGQIRPVAKPFDTLLGPQEDTPFHIRCRSMVVPWMPGFGSDIREEANAELQRRPMKERRIGPGGETGPLPPLARKPSLPGPTPMQELEAAAQKAAERLIEVARGIERPTTRKLKKMAAAGGGKMVGLEFRVKEADSLIRKIQGDVAKTGLGVDKAADGMSDVLRYTMQLPIAKYADGAQATITALRKQGYHARVKNTWHSKKNPYRGVNVAMTAPNGAKFELQFHTLRSFQVKNGEMHKLYEKYRTSTNRAERKQLSAKMWELSKRVPVPDGANAIS